MPSQIRPNRPEVSDRFPMLGFTIKTDGGDKRYEVALASDVSLFRPDARAQRTRSNFYSSRCCGLQPITAGESVYVLPPEVLARFVGQEKLYYALVTYSGSNGGPPEITAVPSAGSAYISLRGLTGRSLKRIRILPNRQRANANYGNGSGTDLEWGGDVAMPGSQTVTAPAAPANGHNGNGAAIAPAPADVNYSDGFGPMPPPAAAVEPSVPASAPAAQGLGTAYRSYQMPVRAQSGAECFSINWDDVQLIAQPTDNSCWATAGAMVIGWYNQQSISPDTVAQIAGRTTKLGIYPNEHCPFGTDIGLICEAPMCYTIDGFRNLLENYGPLWVGIALPGSGHAVVVTGMYSDGAADGSDTYIRVADPWDRVVGSPGSPGTYLNTHNTGSRYIMTWAAFMQEYEDRASSEADGTVNVQILHATSSRGRQPSRSGAVGYAQGMRAGNGNGHAAVRRMPAYARPLTVPRIPVELASRIQMPPAREATTLERIGIEAALVALTGPLAPTLTALRALASTQNVSVGIGPAAAVGFGLGLGAGVGVIFAPGGRIGVYGQLDVRAGIIDSASLGAQVTIMRGNIESWNEVVFAVGGAFVEGIEVTVQVLFNAEHGFRGISFELGVGLAVEPFEVFIAIEGTAAQQVAGAPAAAHGLSAAYRPYQMPVRAQSGESFSINWDDVQLIAQPTDNSCWATAGAMVIGWYNQQSISPDTVAQIAGRTTKLGIYPNEHCPFGSDIGLVCEAPACYTVDGFASLLENYGPLWVGIALPGSGHAVVVTGMYSGGAADGSDTYIRVADPWDRVVGSPGSPGAYLNTHNTGSRYIMTWAAFMQEYEDRATSEADGTVNVQILHATSSRGRQPSRSGAVGYAQAIALDGTSFSINWDDLQPFPQPTDITGWAAAAAMIICWAEEACPVDDPVQRVITLSGRGGSTPLLPGEHSQLATALDFGTAGFGQLRYEDLQSLLETWGPLWLSLQIGGPDGHAHSVVVTGMYSDGATDGSDTYVRITDPWPRAVGTPGAPGAYGNAPGTVSKYIMKWSDFKKQYEDRQQVAPLAPLIMHSKKGVALRMMKPRRQTGPGGGYAQSYSGNGSRVNLPPPPKPVVRSRAMDVGSVAITSAIAGAPMERVTGRDGEITWELEQLRGMKHPNDVAPSPAPAFSDAPTIRLDDWPFIDVVRMDRLSAWFSVDWQYNGRSLGNVRISNVGTNGAMLRGLTVDARITDDNIVYPAGNPTFAALRIRFTYRFSKTIGSDSIAITDLHLYGDGTFEKTSHWEQH